VFLIERLGYILLNWHPLSYIKKKWTKLLRVAIGSQINNVQKHGGLFDFVEKN
jgi:hypothetical protein